MCNVKSFACQWLLEIFEVTIRQLSFSMLINKPVRTYSQINGITIILTTKLLCFLFEFSWVTHAASCACVICDGVCVCVCCGWKINSKNIISCHLALIWCNRDSKKSHDICGTSGICNFMTYKFNLLQDFTKKSIKSLLFTHDWDTVFSCKLHGQIFFAYSKSYYGASFLADILQMCSF